MTYLDTADRLLRYVISKSAEIALKVGVFNHFPFSV